MDSFFVGKKTKPKFLIETSKAKKQISIYVPDKFSKNEEFYEKYSLGKLLLQTKYTKIIFVKSEIQKIKKNYDYIPEIIVKIKNKYFLISTKIQEMNQNLL